MQAKGGYEQEEVEQQQLASRVITKVLSNTAERNIRPHYDNTVGYRTVYRGKHSRHDNQYTFCLFVDRNLR